MKPLPSPARKSGSAGLLHRNREFRLLWAGQVVSVFGSQISRLAYPLLVLAMSGSPARAPGWSAPWPPCRTPSRRSRLAYW